MDGEVDDFFEVGANDIDVADDDDSDIMRGKSRQAGRSTPRAALTTSYGTGFPGYGMSSAWLSCAAGLART